jgi:hypothetical protein
MMEEILDNDGEIFSEIASIKIDENRVLTICEDDGSLILMCDIDYNGVLYDVDEMALDLIIGIIRFHRLALNINLDPDVMGFFAHHNINIYNP